MAWLFLLAYTCSGLAGLIYQVSWTRLLTLHIGHTTAAASAVVAAFLGGLALGAAGGGTLAHRLTRRQSLRGYVALELGVALAALLLPPALDLLRPLLAWAYADGAPGALFPLVRLLTCLLLVFVPALALGASFPLAIRWFATGHAGVDAAARARAAKLTGALYTVNTAGAAVGAIVAGFVLLPAIGVSGTTWVGVAASVAAAASVALVLRAAPAEPEGHGNGAEAPSTPVVAAPAPAPRGRERKGKPRVEPTAPVAVVATPVPAWLPAGVLTISGFAALLHEIAWTRVLTLLLGPTVYAFSATVAAVILGAALGSALGTWLSARVRHHAAWLTGVLLAAAATAGVAYGLAGAEIPRVVAREVATAPDLVTALLGQGLALTAALILPTALCFGAAFPIGIALAASAAGPASDAPRRFGVVYALNTLGAVAGSLAAGFVVIPWAGLQPTIWLVCACLVAAALLVAAVALTTPRAKVVAMAGAAATIAAIVSSPAWDRELLASGAYLYAPFVPKDLDLEAQLRAGELLYYREGAAATVSVKRLTGTTTLAVDGKTDASNRGDMLTQKLIAHVPLLMHDAPRRVAIVGYGSGVTVGAALTHPVEQVDVVEISPEVVEAAAFFAAENHEPLKDPRTRLIVGDGRSHLQLGRAQYDVIISEPSNPWIAGVASLFTREFFEAVRERLAPGGLLCQWANAYNIADADLRAIAATFRAVFPQGTMWLVGGDDLVFVAADGPIDDRRLEAIRTHWDRPGVAEDLREVEVREPFSVWSLFIGGADELARYAEGGGLLTDDHLWLEFSAPRALAGRDAGDNAQNLLGLLGPDEGPRVIRDAHAQAGPAEWRNRGVMMARSDVHATAYADFIRALKLDIGDQEALDGAVRAAVLTRRGADALGWLKALTDGRPVPAAVLVARAKLLASIGERSAALDAATEATTLQPPLPAAFEQVASLHADAADLSRLAEAVTALERVVPGSAPAHFYAAVLAFLQEQPEAAVARATAAVTADPAYAATYDLLGAAQTRLGKPAEARAAFERSLALDSRDSTAYANLGLIELASGDRQAAASRFAEALWLTPDSQVARAGLAQALGR